MNLTRNLWPWGIVAAFGLFFCGIATVVIIASTHRDALVSDDYYEQELRFQGQIDSSVRAKKAGARLDFDPAAGRVTVTLPATQPAGKISGSITCYRPSEPKLDREFPLELRPDGIQTLDVSGLAAGNWLVRVAWRVNGEGFFLADKIVIAGK